MDIEYKIKNQIEGKSTFQGSIRVKDWKMHLLSFQIKPKKAT